MGFMSGWNILGLSSRRGRAVLAEGTTPTRESPGLAQLNLEALENEKDARYDQMTPEEREDYYVHPTRRARWARRLGRR